MGRLEKHELGLMYYLHLGLKQNEIAERLEVHKSTVSKWADKYGWEGERRKMTLNPDYIVQHIDKYVVEFMDTGKLEAVDYKEIQKVTMLLNLRKEYRKTLDAPQEMGVFKRLNEYMKFDLKWDNDLMERIMDAQMQYLSEKYGKDKQE